MSQCLPTGGFKWLTPKQINKIMSKTLLPDKDKGYIYIYLYIYIYIFEVDLDYPEDLHELHNDYP